MRECPVAAGGWHGGPGGDRHLRGLGLLLAARGRARGEDRHALRAAVGQLLPGHGRGPHGRVPAAPRSQPLDPAAQGQLPRQRVGDALAGREGRHQPVRRRLAPAPRGARPLRGQRPVRGPDERSRRHLLRRADRVPRLVGRDLRPGPARDRARGHPRARDHRPRRRHGRRDPGPALLHEGRVQVVQRRRVGGHQHDPVPGGVPVPRAGHGGRQHRADHRLRRGRPGGDHGRHGPRRPRRVRAERRADPQGRAGHGRPVPGGPGRARGAGRPPAHARATATRPARRTSASSRRACRRLPADDAPATPPHRARAHARLRPLRRADPARRVHVRAVQPARPPRAGRVAGARHGLRGDRGRGRHHGRRRTPQHRRCRAVPRRT